MKIEVRIQEEEEEDFFFLMKRKEEEEEEEKEEEEEEEEKEKGKKYLIISTINGNVPTPKLQTTRKLNLPLQQNRLQKGTGCILTFIF